MAERDTEHQPVVIYWTLFSQTGRPLACELSRTDRGLWVRCLDQHRNVVRSERVGAAAGGLDLASEWKQRLLEQQQYVEHPPRSTGSSTGGATRR